MEHSLLYLDGLLKFWPEFFRRELGVVVLDIECDLLVWRVVIECCPVSRLLLCQVRNRSVQGEGICFKGRNSRFHAGLVDIFVVRRSLPGVLFLVTVEVT